MKIGIEDFCEDIVGKAMRGTKTSEDGLASAACVPKDAIRAVLEGGGEESTVRAVAPHLSLDAEKLAVSFHRAWEPEVRSLDGFFMTNTPYHDMFVNAYLIWDEDSKQGVILDTGADASGLITEAEKKGVDVTHILLTHTHRDHIMDLDRVQRAFPKASVHVGARESFDGAQAVEPGDTFQVGALTIEARLTWGHSEGGITYLIQGLTAPLAVVGDAVFAGSMGGGMVSFGDALRTNNEEILSLPGETIICPGHGPLTTVGEEKAHNPFF